MRNSYIFNKLFIVTNAETRVLPFRESRCVCNFFSEKKLPKNLVKTNASARSHQVGKIMQTSARNSLQRTVTCCLISFVRKSVCVNRRKVQAISDKQPG